MKEKNTRTIIRSTLFTLIVSVFSLYYMHDSKAQGASFEKPALIPGLSVPIEWSTHATQDAANRHRKDMIPKRVPHALGDGALQNFPDSKRGENLIVYGYLPYWEFDAEIPWSEITHLGYFAVSGSGTGAVTNDHGWGEAEQLALLEEAHSHGVRLDLVVTLFSESQLESVLSSPAKRAVFAENLTDLAILGQADGINLDFEGMPATVKEDLVSFVLELSATVWEHLPDAEISLAMPAIDWNGAYDYDLLAAASDFLFIMCYGYHWSGGSPGPNAPINSEGPWSHKSIGWTIDDYIEWGGGESVLDKLVIGLPSYGHNWPTTSAEIPGTATDKATSPAYHHMRDGIGFENFTTEPESGEKYYVYQDEGTWRQVFGDDGETTGNKVGWILDRGVRGYGFWALGYDANDPEYWEPIRDKVHATLGYPGSVAPPTDAGSPPEDSFSTDPVDAGAVGDPGVEQDNSFPSETILPDTSPGNEGLDSLDFGGTSNEDSGATQVVRESAGCNAHKNANKSGWVFLLFMLVWIFWMRVGPIEKNGRRAEP